jgi:hypothetical protein
MAFVPGRPTPIGGHTFKAGISRVDRRPHPLQNIPTRTARPINYSPLGPSTLHVASPLKNPKSK